MQRRGIRAGIAVAAGVAAVVGLSGCGSDILKQAADTVGGVLSQVDTVALQAAATQAVTSVATFVVTNQRLPTSLQEAGFTPPEGVDVRLLHEGGLAFAICATSGERAFKADATGINAVESC